MKKWVRISLTVFGILVAVFLLANLAINFWLQNKLPDYVKNNSDYKISYKSLNVEIGTGDIFSSGLTVASKNPANKNVIGLDGTIDTLKISRLGLYDAIFNKRINSTDLLLVNPNLKVTLAKPIDDKTGKKRNPVVFENINIKKGNIQIFRHTAQKFVSVEQLNLFVENLQMTEESVENKLPVVFDKYDINGKNFYFRPDNVYALKAQTITTKSGLMNLRNFQLIPLLSISQFNRYYPNKGNLFDFKATEMDFQDIVLKNNKIALANVRFEKPEIKMYTSPRKSVKQKSFKYEVSLDDILLNNAKVEILKSNGNRIFSAADLKLNIQRLLMDEESAKGNIPFGYEKFRIDGKNINFRSDNEDIKVASIAVNQNSADLRNITAKPIGSSAGKTSADLTGGRIRFTVNDWKLENKKLKLDANNLWIENLNGTISAANNKNKPKAKPTYAGIEFPLKVKNVNIKNSNIVFDQGAKPLVFKDLNANINNIEMNEQTVKDGIPFKTGNYSLTTRNFTYQPNKYYQMAVGLLKFNNNTVQLNNFAMKPLVSRAQFIRSIPAEKDLYDLKANQIVMAGKWDLFSGNKFIDASSLSISGLNANIFRSKVPKDDLTHKPLYSKLLRSIKFPLFIAETNIRNSTLVYEEDTKKSDGPGKLVFGNFSMNIKNLNSGKSKGKPTQIPITVNCLFMNASPMNVKWNLNTADLNDTFTIAGNIADLPASRINPFIEPYLKVRATGLISDLIFNFRGNNAGLNGTLKMKHQELKIALLKETGEKNKLLSAVANIFVKTDSGVYPESVPVDNVPRDPTKSFFNLFWKGIEEGLKKTLIGVNVEKTEESVRNTVENTKTALETNKEQMKDVKGDVKNAVQDAKEAVKETTKKVTEPKKEGLLQKIFRKKEKAEN